MFSSPYSPTERRPKRVQKKPSTVKASKPRKSSTEEDFEPPQVVIQAKPIMPTLIKPKKSSPEREFLKFFYA